MLKITSLIPCAVLIALLAISSIAADPPAQLKTTSVHITFKSNATLLYYIKNGTLVNIEKDLLSNLGTEDYLFRQYTFSNYEGRNSSITINLREVASVTIEK
jgi:hypothetical protein